jgi:uncharacterized protein YidB (DUF937 family)
LQILENLARAQGGALLANIGKSYGLDEEQVAATLGAVLPQLAAGIERNTLSRGGIADMVRAIGDGHHTQYLDRPELIGTQAMVADGNAILDHILGGKDASRGVASRAAATSGVSAGLIRQLLPVIAAMLMGWLSKQGGGGLGEILKRLPTGGDGRPQVPGSGDLGDIGDILKRIPGMPGSRGSVGGDQAPAPAPRSASADPSRPLPLPDRIPGINAPAERGPNPFEDLSDVVRRGAPPMSPSAGPLGNVVRDLLGGLLGFQNKGVLSWLFTFLLYRFGGAILKRILGR